MHTDTTALRLDHQQPQYYFDIPGEIDNYNIESSLSSLSSSYYLEEFVNRLPKTALIAIYRVMYETYFVKNNVDEIPKFDNVNYEIIDLFIKWWSENPTNSYFTVRQFYKSDESYSRDMETYLSGNESRWFAFFRARTGIIPTCQNPEHVFNFFQNDACLDRDILAKTFRLEYANSLRLLQHEASQRSLRLRLDNSMMMLSRYGSQEFHRQHDLQRSLTIQPQEIPNYNSEKLYIIDWGSPYIDVIV